ncbi:MAG: hypothetical protein JSR86_11715 [Proteobacteria bacterium]|nr:hypothetical protein [Pseudomonadota bacterium]
MRMRWLGGAVALAVLGLLGAAPASAADPAPEPDPSAGFSDFMTAGDALLVAIGAPGRPALPKADDPVAHRFIAEAETLTRSLKVDHAPSMDVLQAACGESSKVMVAYEMSGLEPSILRNASDPKVAATVRVTAEKNLRRYFDVVLPTMLFSLHCSAASVISIEDFLAKLPKAEMTDVRIGGAHKVQSGSLHMLQGMLSVLSDPALPSGDKGRIIAQLETDWDEMLLVLPSQSREGLRSLTVQVALRLERDQRVRLDALAQRVGKVRCGVICAI